MSLLTSPRPILEMRNFRLRPTPIRIGLFPLLDRDPGGERRAASTEARRSRPCVVLTCDECPTGFFFADPDPTHMMHRCRVLFYLSDWRWLNWIRASFRNPVPTAALAPVTVKASRYYSNSRADDLRVLSFPAILLVFVFIHASSPRSIRPAENEDPRRLVRSSAFLFNYVHRHRPFMIVTISVADSGYTLSFPYIRFILES
ncbi:hypothetical protein BJ912DRAFT_589897 [Pholiota molesta]|nr:hypothetical protein BJ912DRAFT_589897 [Pholiota molesta]